MLSLMPSEMVLARKFSGSGMCVENGIELTVEGVVIGVWFC